MRCWPRRSPFPVPAAVPSLAAAVILPPVALRALAAPPVVGQTVSLDKVRFTWNQSALCLISFAMAQEDGIFRKHGLDVELLNSGGSTDLMLETLAIGATAGIDPLPRP